MLESKLQELELDLKYKIFQDQKKLNTVKSLKELLHQVDFNVEHVSTQTDKIIELLIDLKGSDLTEEEKTVVQELVA